MSRKPVGLTEDQIRLGYSKATNAKAAADAIGVNPSTFRRYAKVYGLYVTNQGGKGESRDYFRPSKVETKDLLQKGVYTKSAVLKSRLLTEGLIENVCDECKLGPTWNNKPLVLHLDHIDGDNINNERSNLRLLCPNCHSQTSTYCRGQGKKLASLAK